MKWIEWDKNYLLNLDHVASIFLDFDEAGPVVIAYDLDFEEIEFKEFETIEEAKEFYEEIRFKLTKLPILKVDISSLEKGKLAANSCRYCMPGGGSCI